MRRIIITVAAAGLALAGSAGVAAAGAPVVTGSGVGTITTIPAFEGDTVQMELSAQRFNIVHHSAGGGVFAHLTGYLDCVAGDGDAVVVTGVITAGADDLGVDPVGHRVSIAVTDGSPDTMAVDVSFFSGHSIPPCTSDPVLVLPVQHGNFTVR